MKYSVFKSFEKSSKIYDALYSKKNYKKEILYLLKIIKKKRIKNLLDIGCGTCSHLISMNNIYINSVGIDSNPQMISIAKSKIKKKKIKNIKLYNSDVTNFKTKSKFDLITSMFHVVNYLTKKKEIEKFFYLSSKSLTQNGILLFDFWNKNNKKKISENGYKKFVSNGLIIERKKNAIFSKKKSITKVNFEYNIKNIKNFKKIKFSENHYMKSFSENELTRYAQKYNLNKVFAYKWLTTKKLNKKDDTGIIIFRKN